MHILCNQYVETLDDMMTFPNQKFNPVFAEQLLNSRSSVLDDMCSATGAKDYLQLRSEKLNVRTITKEKLCVWLETVVSILDSFCAPVLRAAAELPGVIDQLKDDKIVAQDTIIELQGKLIEKKEQELGSVKTTVQTEMNSYSSVLRNACAKALAPKKMKAAMKSVAEEEDRSNNLIIYGLGEKEGENLEERICEVLEQLDEKPRIVNCCRMGKDGGPAVKPVKFSLAGTDHVRQILSKTRRLRDVDGYTSVYICPDRSAEQRAAFKKLVEVVKQKRTDEPNRVHIIKNNKIVSSEKG